MYLVRSRGMNVQCWAHTITPKASLGSLSHCSKMGKLPTLPDLVPPKKSNSCSNGQREPGELCWRSEQVLVMVILYPRGGGSGTSCSEKLWVPIQGHLQLIWRVTPCPWQEEQGWMLPKVPSHPNHARVCHPYLPCTELWTGACMALEGKDTKQEKSSTSFPWPRLQTKHPPIALYRAISVWFAKDLSQHKTKSSSGERSCWSTGQGMGDHSDIMLQELTCTLCRIAAGSHTKQEQWHLPATTPVKSILWACSQSKVSLSLTRTKTCFFNSFKGTGDLDIHLKPGVCSKNPLPRTKRGNNISNFPGTHKDEHTLTSEQCNFFKVNEPWRLSVS